MCGSLSETHEQTGRYTCPLCGKTDASVPVAKNTVFGQPFDVCFCSTCALYFLPCQPSEAFIKEYYKNEYYAAQQNSSLAYGLRSWFSGMRALSQYLYIEQFTGLSPGKQVLEIGSSDGSLLSLFKQRGWAVRGLEYSEFSINKAREKYRIELEPKDIFDIDPDRFRCDLILFSHVLEHMRDPREVLRHCKKLLTPGGVIFVELPQTPLESECGGEALSRYFVLTHMFDFRTESLETLIRQADLAVVSIDRYFYQVPPLFMKYRSMFGRMLMTGRLPSKNPLILPILSLCLINSNLRFFLHIDPMMKIMPGTPWLGLGDMIRTIVKKQ